MERLFTLHEPGVVEAFRPRDTSNFADVG